MTTIQVAIERRERTNSKGETYSQYYRDGKICGCGCKQAEAITIEKYGFMPCKHIRDAQATEAITGVDLAVHVQDDLLNSCCTCGYPTKGIICWRCLA